MRLPARPPLRGAGGSMKIVVTLELTAPGARAAVSQLRESLPGVFGRIGDPEGDPRGDAAVGYTAVRHMIEAIERQIQGVDGDAPQGNPMPVRERGRVGGGGTGERGDGGR